MIVKKVPLYVIAGRVLFVTGLSLSLAIGILFLLGGYWQWGLLALVCALPFLALMFLIERGRQA